ncbi:MAG: hypothetical protein JNM55_16895 [Anaerolineales bacterium]|nr:hypothetical protein [Anaerolineales bacterium]
MNNVYDILEVCLQELEKGTDLDSLLARYPNHAVELRPMLQAAIRARSMSAAEPSPDAMRRGRAKLMQRAAEMREEKVVPIRKPIKRVIPAFQRWAMTLSLTATLLVSGTGLVGASSTALPGENLYPVKRTWEDMRLFFTFDTNQRDMLESEFESERLHEANKLIAEGRHETIQFAGVFMEINGKAYISGIQVVITANTQLPADVIQTGSAVVVTGHTNAEGFVELESMELLPAGAVVPMGNPVEVESPESSSEGNSNSSAGPAAGAVEAGSGNQGSNSSTFKLEGTVDSFSNNAIMVNGQQVYLDSNTRIEGQIKPGSKVEVEGYYDKNGKFIVKKIKVEESKSGSGNSSSNDNSNSGSDSSDSGDDSGDDHSGSGGGGDDGGGDDD